MPAELIYPLGVVFAGYVVFGITGFGSALLIVPLLALRLPLSTVVPLVLLLDLVASAQLGHLNFSAIRFNELRRLLPGILIGAAIGLYLARWGDHPVLLFMLGAYIAGIGLRGWRSIATSNAFTPLPTRWAMPYGVATGAIEALFGTSGPVIVAYLTRRIDDAQALRSTIASGIFIVVVLTLAGMGAVGRLSDPALWQRLPWLLVATVSGCFLGHHAARHLAGNRLRRAIFAVLVASGLTMAGHAATGLAAG